MGLEHYFQPHQHYCSRIPAVLFTIAFGLILWSTMSWFWRKKITFAGKVGVPLSLLFYRCLNPS
jgi:hypothetical protein